MHWQNLATFKGIDLNDSFVMSWERGEKFVSFKLLASIWPESAFYSKPKPGEYTCYKPAVLEFRGCSLVAGLKPMSLVKPTQDIDGTNDYGNVDTLVIVKNGYEISGEFGHVHITGGEFNFVLPQT